MLNCSLLAVPAALLRHISVGLWQRPCGAYRALTSRRDHPNKLLDDPTFKILQKVPLASATGAAAESKGVAGDQTGPFIGQAAAAWCGSH